MPDRVLLEIELHLRQATMASVIEEKISSAISGEKAVALLAR